MVQRLSPTLPILLLVAGCAANSPETATTDQSEPTDAAATLASAETIDVSELDTGLICERATPTGSRIAEQQCYTKEQYEQWQASVRETVQRDVNEMRDLQRSRELAEQAAARQAIEAAMRGGF